MPAPEPALETTAYVTSGAQLMLRAPSDWTISQQDGGSASVIVMESTSGQEWAYVAFERARTFEGETISYADWLSGKTGLVLSGIETVGGRVFDSYTLTTESGEARTVLTGEVPGAEVNLFVTITTPEVASATSEAIVSSIVFNPSEAESAGAQVIR